MHSRSLQFLAAALVAAVVPGQAPKSLPRSASDLLPPSTYGVVHFGGLDRCVANAREWPIAEMLGTFVGNLPDEVRQQHLDEGLDRAAQQVRRALERVRVSPEEVRRLLRCPMTLAVGRPTIEGMGPSVALLIEEGDSGETIDRLLDHAGSVLTQRGATLRDETVAGLPARVIEVPSGPPVFLARFAGHRVLTNSRGMLGEMAAVHGGNARGLAALGELRARLGGDPVLAAYANTSVVTQMLEPVLPYEAGDWADALGLGSLDALFAGFGATKDGGVDLVHVGFTGGADGLFKAAAHKPATFDLAHYCSDNTVLFGARSLDLPAVIDAAHRFVALLPGPARQEFQREVGRELARELRQAGTTPAEVDRIVRAFGDQVGFALSLEKGAIPKPELLVRVAVRDREIVAALLRQVEQLVVEAGFEWKTRRVDGREVRYFSLPLEDQLQLSPCYVLTDDALLLGSDVLGLNRALRQAESPDESLAAREDFQAMTKHFAGANGVLHLRAFRLAELGWRTVETLGYPQIDAHRETIGFGSEALPDAETVAEALGCSTFAQFVDERGFTQQHRGLVTIGALLAGAATLADEVLARAGAKIY